MTAHLIATIDTTTLKVERVAIFSQGVSSMSGIPSGYAMAELLKFDGDDSRRQKTPCSGG